MGRPGETESGGPGKPGARRFGCVRLSAAAETKDDDNDEDNPEPGAVAITAKAAAAVVVAAITAVVLHAATIVITHFVDTSQIDEFVLYYVGHMKWVHRI